MQNSIAYSPAAATTQHVPNGWNFPTLSPIAAQPGAQPGPAPVVMGGGATHATITRVRWGRLLPLLAGVVLLAFGAMTFFGDDASGTGDTKDRGTVSGGGAGTNEVDIVRSARTDAPDAADIAGTTDAPAVAPAAAVKAPVAKTTAAAKTAAARRAAVRRAAARKAAARKAAVRKAAARKAAAPTAAAAVAAAAPAPAAAAPARTVAGGGAGAAAELPYTGLETWIAAILGILLLGVGICVHVNAVRIGMTAMLYRRGILLRPVDCARLAQERGLPRLRVLLSNVLHRLLEEPATSSDFVAARIAH